MTFNSYWEYSDWRKANRELFNNIKKDYEENVHPAKSAEKNNQTILFINEVRLNIKQPTGA